MHLQRTRAKLRDDSFALRTTTRSYLSSTATRCVCALTRLTPTASFYVHKARLILCVLSCSCLARLLCYRVLVLPRRLPSVCSLQASINDLDLEELLPAMITSPSARSGVGSEANTPYFLEEFADGHGYGDAAIMPYAIVQGGRDFDPTSPPLRKRTRTAVEPILVDAPPEVEPEGEELGTPRVTDAAAVLDELAVDSLTKQASERSAHSNDRIAGLENRGWADEAAGASMAAEEEGFDEGFGVLEGGGEIFQLSSGAQLTFGSLLAPIANDVHEDAEDVRSADTAEGRGQGTSKGRAARRLPASFESDAALQDELEELDQVSGQGTPVSDRPPDQGQGAGRASRAHTRSTRNAKGLPNNDGPGDAVADGIRANNKAKPRARKPRKPAPLKPMVIDAETQLSVASLQARIDGPPEDRGVNVALFNRTHAEVAGDPSSPASSASIFSASTSSARNGAHPPAPFLPRAFFHEERKRARSGSARPRAFSSLDDTWKVYEELERQPCDEEERVLREHALQSFPPSLLGGPCSNLLGTWVRVFTGTVLAAAAKSDTSSQAERDEDTGGGKGEAAFDVDGYASGEGEGTPELFRDTDHPNVEDLDNGFEGTAGDEAAVGEETDRRAHLPRRGSTLLRRSSALAGLSPFAFDEDEWEQAGAFGSPGDSPADVRLTEEGVAGQDEFGSGAARPSPSAELSSPFAIAEFNLDAAAFRLRSSASNDDEEEEDGSSQNAADVPPEGGGLPPQDGQAETSAPALLEGSAPARTTRPETQSRRRSSSYGPGAMRLFEFLKRMLPADDSKIDYLDDFLVCQLRKRRSRASAFGQLLALVSDDLLALEQKQPFGKIIVRRGEAFDADMPHIPGAAATIAEEEQDVQASPCAPQLVRGMETEDDFPASTSSSNTGT